MSHRSQTISHDELALDAAIAEYLELVDRGQEFDVAEFLAKHGKLAPQLREFLEMASFVEEIVAVPPLPDHKSAAMKETSGSVVSQETLYVHDAPPQEYALAPPTGVQFGRYYLLDTLGEGSMGKVQLAYDTTLDRLVALKMPRFDNGLDSVERFYREARSSATLRHPNICPVFDVGTIEGVHFLSMAYIDGQSLASVLEKHEPQPIAYVLRIVGKLASALEEAHRHNVIHRDLKPANIMLDAAGEPIVTDFGLARRLGARDTLLTQSGMLIGTLAFMSPEQMEGMSSRINRTTDIYSLGVIFYQLLTGMLPFKGSFVSVVVQVRHGRPVPPSMIRPEIANYPGLEAICLKMMAKRPEQRYGSMAEVSQALAALAHAPPASPPPLPLLKSSEPQAPPVALASAPPTVQVESQAPVRLLHQLRTSPYRWMIGGASCVGLLSLLAILFIASGLGNSVAALPDPKPADTAAKINWPTTDPSLPGKVFKGVGATDNESKVPSGNVPDTLPPTEPKQPKQPVALFAAATPPKVTASRVVERKFGVAQLSIAFDPGTGPEFRPDYASQVVAITGSVHYPAFTMELEEQAAPEAVDAQRDADAASDALIATAVVNPYRGRIARLTAHFLCLDEKPLKVSVFYAGQALVADQKIPVDVVPDRRPLLNEWWAAYTAPTREPLNAEARQVKQYLNEMLARRLELPAAAEIPSPKDEASLLEKYFEMSVGAFLGFLSVNEGFGSHQKVNYGVRETADRPVPVAPQIAAVPIPAVSADVAIEAIASHVPDDCVYLRCQSLDNYLWFRQFLLGWGGSLNEVISSHTSDDRTRERLEQQLALALDEELSLVLKRTVTDLAVIFADPFFDQGTGVGVVFQAKHSAELERLLARQRAAAEKRFARYGASEKEIKFGQHPVSLLSTGDKRLLSYLTVQGDYVLVTNSQYLVTRFLESGVGRRNLASLAEFKYARTKVQVHDEQSVFLYMSDPFFQRIISPHYYIERLRRSQSRQELEQLALAHLAARSENSPRRSTADLVNNRYLPDGFGTRSDGSQAVLKTYDSGHVTQAEDSKRGLPGYFLPICDMKIAAATYSEEVAYKTFVEKYRREYRMMDPVALVASHRSIGDGQQEVDLEITITPYAFNKYAGLRNYLVAPLGKKIAGHADDILQLNAAMRTENGQPFLTYAGLRDRELAFRLVDGRVQIEGEDNASSFAEANHYLAFDRRDSECLLSVAGITNDLGLTNVNIARARDGMNMIPGLVTGIARLPLLLFNPRAYHAPVERASGPGWYIRSNRSDLKNQELNHANNSDTKQARLELHALQGRRVEPYIQAYTFLEARRASARNVALLELVSQQLQLHDVEALDSLERVFTDRLVCPLGGEYTQGANNLTTGPLWRSDKWTAPSLYDENTVPSSYRFAFCDWLRNLNVGFALEAQTLKADVQLQVKPPAEIKPAKSQVVKGAAKNR